MQVYGLLGNPVEHSLSPPMHEAAYETLGLDARYVTFEPDRDAAAAAVAAADTLGIAGLNVTIPFKRDVLDAVDLDDIARRVGAVNTIDFSGETPTGHNTDVAGVERVFGGLFDRLGSVEVRLSDREVDDVLALGFQFGGEVRDGDGRGRFDSLDTV